MAETGKKVEVRYGAFACTIEGYDNPVEQLQKILGEMQRMIAETPQMSQVGSGSEAEEIQEALSPEAETEPGSPGIVVIRDRDDADAGGAAAKTAAAAEDVAEAEEISWPEAEPEVEAVAPQETDTPSEAADASEAEAPVAAQADASSDDIEDAEPDTEDGVGIAAIAGVTAAAIAGVGTIALADDDKPSSDAGDVAEAEGAVAEVGDAVAEATDAAVAEDNLWSLPDNIDPVDTSTTEPSEPDAPAEPDSLAEGLSEDLADDLAEDLPEDLVPLADADAAVAEAAAATPQPQPQPQPLNIFAAPEASDPFPDVEPAAEVEAEPEAECVPEPEIAALDAAEPQIAEPEVAEPVNIFAAPEPAPQEPARQEPVNIFAAPAAAEVPEADVAAQAPEAEPEPEPEPAPQAAPSVNIFAAPEPEPAPEPASPSIDVPEEVAAPNTVAAPASRTAAFLAAAAAKQPSTNGAQIWDDATEALEQATPSNVEQTLEELGQQVTSQTESMDAVVEDAVPAAETGFSIFAPPAEEAAPEPIAPEPEPAPEPEAPAGNRFQSLLKQVHGSSMMGAPGEPEAYEPPAPEPEPGLSSGIETAGDLARRAGSESVSDLLAASAAWLTLAEGKGQFSRREVMDVFERIEGDHPRTLEARIKGYGRLVRSGMLILVDDGVFAMAQTERERFRTILDQS